ncbi:MAG: copper chaperone PCu(A)C [Lysobacterales bacterium]
MRRLAAVCVVFSACLGVVPAAFALGKLEVYDAVAEIVATKPELLAGYATLKNTGDESVRILTVQCDDFRAASIQDVIGGGDAARMREMPWLRVDPGETVSLAPGGKRILLREPRNDFAPGDMIDLFFLLADGRRVEAYFDVTAGPTGGD